LETKRAEQVLWGGGVEREGGPDNVYIYVSKCKNNKKLINK
jgi:hypothetical protein